MKWILANTKVAIPEKIITEDKLKSVIVVSLQKTTKFGHISLKPFDNGTISTAKTKYNVDSLYPEENIGRLVFRPGDHFVNIV